MTHTTDMSEELAAIADLPKVELHTHLEGCAPPAFIAGMAREKKIDLSKIFTPQGTYAYRDFVHFLSVYEAATTVLTTPEDFKRLTRAVLEETAQSGVIYMETFVSPDFCGGSDLGAWREYLAHRPGGLSWLERGAGGLPRLGQPSHRHAAPRRRQDHRLDRRSTVLSHHHARRISEPCEDLRLGRRGVRGHRQNLGRGGFLR